ncbi:hypothetical protein [Chitinophaga sp. Cy-1792]|uniref:hypothetical protein n=1 Tax=Chitinophaga sp. Cy-1792 TaxID=2608339 RepID=UPI0014202F05|nr:hypothetical protein [Chitinophaga sp. Cy-1792]NIG54818.1 hypothetical protein [Chitinophaga sp. Cy-1792]
MLAQKENQSEKMITIPEMLYLSLVSERLKDRILFPESLARMKAILEETDQEEFLALINKNIACHKRAV